MAKTWHRFDITANQGTVFLCSESYKFCKKLVNTYALGSRHLLLLIASTHLRFYQFKFEFKLWHVEKTKINRKRRRDWLITHFRCHL